ncbi:MAG: hypothetical protein ISR83_02590 [Candidatus Marinimicrobia bacterium]|nr:hypothetical protein [Candidatus Neomarinimicrobiota bacterium]
MKHNPRRSFRRKHFGVLYLSGALSLLLLSGCDFETSEKFEMPTWFIDLKIPLVQQRYSLDGIVDSVNIFPSDDGLGMQLVFEGDLPSQSIGEDNLQVQFPGGYLDTEIAPTEIPGVDLGDFAIPSTPINMSLPVVLYGIPYVDTTYDESNPLTWEAATFYMPPAEDREISAENWNTMVGIFNSTVDSILGSVLIELDLGFSDIDLTSDPQIIDGIEALVVANSDASQFITSIGNQGISKNLIQSTAGLYTGKYEITDSLAHHETIPTIGTNITYADTTSLASARLRQLLKINLGFKLDSADVASGESVTIYANDSMAVNLVLNMNIPSLDSADVSITETILDIPKPDMGFAASEGDEEGSETSLSIFQAMLKTEGVDNTANRLVISNLASTFPFDINFKMNFQNFAPPAGGDSVIIETVLSKGNVFDRDFDLKGYSFQSTQYPDEPINNMELALDVSIPEQIASIPLDGSSLGGLGLGVRMYSMEFESLEAYVYMGFPSVTQNMDNMPQGFSGMMMTDVRIQFIMYSQIKLPVKLGIDMIGIDTFGDTTTLCVNVDSIGYPINDVDTAMTVIELNKYGTLTEIYNSKSDSAPSWSNQVLSDENCANIIELLSVNPVNLIVESESRVDGRGTIEIGKAIGGGFRLEAPFEVMMAPMTFISAVETPIEEFDHETRNRIRSSLIQAELTSNVTNALPFGAELSILMSNLTLFPSDRSSEMLSVLRDSLVSQQGWDPTDSIYIVDTCLELDPDTSDIHIFNVMTDFSECIDGMPYLVRRSISGTDSVIAYVDTLWKFILPDPVSYYEEGDSSGFPPGMVHEAGTGTFNSTLDSNRIFLLTGYGDHYVAPRFHLNGTDSQSVFMTTLDYLDINSFITFRLSNTGLMNDAQDELVLTWPNGGDTLYSDQSYEILWNTYGDITSVNIDYSTAENPELNNGEFWTPIVQGIENTNAYSWTLSETSGLPTTHDKIRLRLSKGDGTIRDMNGYYIHIRPSAGRMSGNNTIMSQYGNGGMR